MCTRRNPAGRGGGSRSRRVGPPWRKPQPIPRNARKPCYYWAEAIPDLLQWERFASQWPTNGLPIGFQGPSNTLPTAVDTAAKCRTCDRILEIAYPLLLDHPVSVSTYDTGSGIRSAPECGIRNTTSVFGIRFGIRYSIRIRYPIPYPL